MNDGELLLWNLLDNPACDTSRLIYADYLDERGLNGDRERAEFIRVQVELSHPVPMTWPHSDGPICACSRCILRTRERELCDAMTPREGKNARQTQGRAFFAECGAQLAGYTLERGFLRTISLTTAEFMTHAGAIFSRHPVERVVLTDKEPDSFHGGWVFWRDCEPNGGLERDVPETLFRAMWDGHDMAAKSSFSIMRSWIEFATEAEARATLSTACITYGRQCAAALRSASATSATS